MEGEMIITTTTEYVLGNNNETSTVARGEERRGRRRGSKERKDRESAYLEADLTQEIAALRAGLEARLGVDSEAIGRIREKGWLKLLRRTGGDVEIAVRLLQDKEARFEARRQKKLARREARGGEGEDKKLLDKEERLRLKTERKEARLKACEERKERRLEKEKERKEKKEKKVDGARDAGFVDLIEEGGLPHGIKGLYLDGNNMLFISQALRKYVLSRGQRWVAEAALSTIAEEYARLPVVKGGARLETAVMIYDSVPKRTVCISYLIAYIMISNPLLQYSAESSSCQKAPASRSPAQGPTSVLRTTRWSHGRRRWDPKKRVLAYSSLRIAS